MRRAVGYVVGDCRRPKEVDVIEPQFGKLPLLTFNINISGTTNGSTNGSANSDSLHDRRVDRTRAHGQ